MSVLGWLGPAPAVAGQQGWSLRGGASGSPALAAVHRRRLPPACGGGDMPVASWGHGTVGSQCCGERCRPLPAFIGS